MSRALNIETIPEDDKSDVITFNQFSEIFESTNISTDFIEQIDIWKYISKDEIGNGEMKMSDFKEAII